jgi:hypothetical protein
VVRQPPPAISGPNQLWWFAGENPPNYATSIQLTSSAGAATQWSVSSGGDKVSLSTTQGSSIVVTSTGQSEIPDDIRIVASNIAGQDQIDMTVRSPSRMEWLQASSTTMCPLEPWGYETLVTYRVRDQFGVAMPSGMVLNEDWTSGVTNNWPDHNWFPGAWPDPQGTSVSSSAFSDRIRMTGSGTGEWLNPSISCPSLTWVQSRGQAWRIGSQTPGEGKLVQTNVIVFRRGSGFHDDVVSPP